MTTNDNARSYLVEVLAAGETKWATNSLRFTLERDAELWGAGLYRRWTMCDQWRVVPSMDSPNVKADGIDESGRPLPDALSV